MVTHSAFRRHLGQFATGVTVVTTRDAQGLPRGFTASAFTSLSLDPPLVLVCVDAGGDTYPALQVDGAIFAVSILSQEQEALSRIFASKQPDKFHTVAYRDGLLGVPLLDGALTHLECRVVERHTGGDHIILVATVLQAHDGLDAPPLLYHRGRYTRVARQEDACPVYSR